MPIRKKKKPENPKPSKKKNRPGAPEFQIGSCLMIGLAGPKLLQKEKDFIISNKISGVVLFKRNLKSFKQIHSLCREIKSLSRPALLTAIDMEGGRVNRFSHLKESPAWPSPEALKNLPPKKIFQAARALGRMLSLLGIDINFAPCVDMPLVESSVLKSRLFGAAKEEILKSAAPFIKGLADGGAIPCLKHFPGHGGVKEDSHKTLPLDKRGLKELRPQLELFERLHQERFCAIMTAHIEFPKIQPGPGSFSDKLLKNLLKKKMGFKGPLISDDIDMSALKGFSPGERFFKAIRGGCDLVIACQKRSTPYEIIKHFQKNSVKIKELKKELERSSQKILSLRKKKGPAGLDFKSAEKELAKALPKKLRVFLRRLQ